MSLSCPIGRPWASDTQNGENSPNRTPFEHAVVALPIPTFADYVPVVSAAVTDGTRRAYGTYWNRITEHWGTRHRPHAMDRDLV